MLLQGFQIDDDAPQHRLHHTLTVVTGVDPAQREALALELAGAAVARTRHPSSPVAVDVDACILRPVETTERRGPPYDETPDARDARRAALAAERACWLEQASAHEEQLRQINEDPNGNHRVQIARATLDRFQAAAQRSVLAGADALGLEALHAEIEAAAALTERRPRAGNQARIARARAQERELLQRLGFSTWLEYRIAARGPAQPDDQLVEQIRRARADLDAATTLQARRTTCENTLAEAREQVAIIDAQLMLDRPRVTTESPLAFELRVLQQASGLRRHRLPLIVDDPFEGWTREAFEQALALLHDVSGELQVVYLTSDAQVVAWAAGSLDQLGRSVIDLGGDVAGIDGPELGDLLIVNTCSHGATHQARPDATVAGRDVNEVVLPGRHDDVARGLCPLCATVGTLEPCSQCSRGTCRSCLVVPLRSRARLCVACALVAAGVRHRRHERRPRAERRSAR